jgi:uncharacterized protein DUF4395
VTVSHDLPRNTQPARGRRSGAEGILGFPNPVDEVSARLVAAGAGALTALAVALAEPLLLVPVAVGFVLRVLAGPRLSPLALLVTRVVRPRLPIAPRPTAGPPKRFAQGVGAALSTTAAAFGLLGAESVAWALSGALIAAATLEAAVGLCLGCHVFGLLMRAGLVPSETCADCADIWARGDRPRWAPAPQ